MRAPEQLAIFDFTLWVKIFLDKSATLTEIFFTLKVKCIFHTR